MTATPEGVLRLGEYALLVETDPDLPEEVLELRLDDQVRRWPAR